MLESITLLGSASGRNAGDAALISSIMDGIDETCDERFLYEIPTIKPSFIWKNYKNRVRPISIMPWNLSAKLLGPPTYQSVCRTDLSLVFDAILFDRALYNPLFNFMSSLSLLLPQAKRRGKKLGCYTVTAGPVKTLRGREMLVRIAEMMDFITIRDQDSFDILRDLGVQNPNLLITNDAALNTKPCRHERADAIWRALGFAPGEEVLALNVNPYLDTWAERSSTEPLSRDSFVNVYVRGLKRIIKELDVPLLFVSTQHLDESLTREIMARIVTPKKVAFFSNRDYSHHDIKGVMAKVALLFAMRLHCLILTSSAHTPIVALNYLPKVRTYMKSLSLSQHCLNFDDFSEETVYSFIKTGWEKRREIRSTLDGIIPGMQREAMKASELVRAIHTGESIEGAIARLSNSGTNGAEPRLCSNGISEPA